MTDTALAAAIRTKTAELNDLFLEVEKRNLYVRGTLSIMPFNSQKAPSVKLIIQCIYHEVDA